MQSKILDCLEEESISRGLHEGGCQEVDKRGNGASKDLGSPWSGFGPYRKLELRTQMTAAPGKKSTTSVSFFMEAYGFEVEEELSTLATQQWAEGIWTGKWNHEQREAWMKQIQQVQSWKQVRSPARAGMFETRDLGIKWPHRHTLIFEGEVRFVMRHVCPTDVEKMLLHRARTVYWKKWPAKHEYEELKEGIWLEPALALLQKKTK